MMKQNMRYLEDAVAKVGAGVLKRLRFALKIIKGKVAQPNMRNRQAPAYFVEVFDAIGDWSGNENEEMTEMLDQQVFPQLCLFISTFSSAEFDSFQQFLLKYTLVKWKETSSFALLDFIKDLYGFLARFVPTSVVDEYLEIFTRKEMPPYISFIILPSVLRNLPSNYQPKAPLVNGLEQFVNQKIGEGEDLTDELKHRIVNFWKSMGTGNATLTNCLKSSSILQQCVYSSNFLDKLPANHILIITSETVRETGMDAKCA